MPQIEIEIHQAIALNKLLDNLVTKEGSMKKEVVLAIIEQQRQNLSAMTQLIKSDPNQLKIFNS